MNLALNYRVCHNCGLLKALRTSSVFLLPPVDVSLCALATLADEACNLQAASLEGAAGMSSHGPAGTLPSGCDGGSLRTLLFNA